MRKGFENYIENKNLDKNNKYKLLTSFNSISMVPRRHRKNMTI